MSSTAAYIISEITTAIWSRTSTSLDSNTVAEIWYSFAQADEILLKINALK